MTQLQTWDHVVRECRSRARGQTTVADVLNDAGLPCLSSVPDSHAETPRDWLDTFKQRLKRAVPRLVPLLIAVATPVLVRPFVRRFLRRFDLDNDFVVDLGAGVTVHDERTCRVDAYPYASIHLVSDIAALPLGDATVDGILSVAVLEHVPDPEAVVAEMWRVLKPGGKLMCAVPFLQGFHASPHDYQRYTAPGLRELFGKFERLDVSVGAGPTSALVWILQEWLAMLLSFGIEPLYRLILPMTYVLSPLKWLDLVLARHPAAASIASLLVVEATKPE